MTEEEARSWIRERFGVSRETLLEDFAAIVVQESSRQNLIAASTVSDIWNRHLLDSAQLLPFADSYPGAWIDIGSGAGFPGIVAALLSDRPVTLVEPRAKRAAFLAEAASRLGIAARVQVIVKRIEAVTPQAPGGAATAVISARAVANLGDLLASARHLSTRSTLWLLPKGQNAQSEVAAARLSWQGEFHVEPSLTQAESWIVVARDVHQ